MLTSSNVLPTESNTNLHRRDHPVKGSPKEWNIFYGVAGAGKTTTLMNVIKYEIQEKHLDISEIAFVSFTRKAAAEGKARVLSLPFLNDIDEKDLKYFGTLHSITYQELKRLGITSMTSNITRARLAAFGEKVGLTFSTRGETEGDQLDTFDTLYRNNAIAARKLMSKMDMNKAIWYMQNYKKYRDTMNYKDYTDMIQFYIDYGEPLPCKAIIIDEAQDLTTLQWKAVVNMAAHCHRVYVAGDDDQALYEWSGADISKFLGIKGKIRVLDGSHRVPQNICNIANEVIRNVKTRQEKTIHSLNDTKGIVQYVPNITFWYKKFGIRPGETYYFLARNNYLLEVYKKFFDGLGIEYAETTEQNNTSTILSNIVVSTIHRVKGGEADHVIILPDLSKAEQNYYDIDPEPEHRIFYTAITRAKKAVYILQPVSPRYYKMFEYLYQTKNYLFKGDE